jgi:CheY-like chemotaxis protein
MSADDDARILVVDHVPKNRRLLEAVLAPRSYDVVAATDGRGALDSSSPRVRTSCSSIP